MARHAKRQATSRDLQTPIQKAKIPFWRDPDKTASCCTAILDVLPLPEQETEARTERWKRHDFCAFCLTRTRFRDQNTTRFVLLFCRLSLSWRGAESER